MLISFIFLSSFFWMGQNPNPEIRTCNAERIPEKSLHIDGSLDESVWEMADWNSGFIQRDPVDGAQASFQTRFKVVYDDDAIYFAFFMEDEPEKVSKVLARRDRFPGDWIEVNISSYFDRRTAFSFTLSLSGTRGDEFISKDGRYWDSSWDPVWQGASVVVENGWTAEMRIPLSQLRFSNEPDQIWGLQVQRRIFRKEERSTWQSIPKSGTGWVSRFGEIHGLTNLKPKRHIEVLPYAVSGLKRQPVDSDDPFGKQSDSIFEVGVDGKIGLSKNLTLDFTINPDFGQVEADPSEVNLTSFETFFNEKRPFFIEGKNIFDLKVSPAIVGGSFTSDTLFYSRRIGRRPGHDPDADFVEAPDRTRIMGALKLSGKTSGGTSIGLLDSVTSQETALIQDEEGQRRVVVEPQTHFFVGRIQQEYHNGDTLFGGFATSVNRELADDDQLNSMVEDAFAAGLDFSRYFRNRDYRLDANIVFSNVRGSEEAIENLQTSSARYYQRPDHSSQELDPNRTELSGHAGSIRFTRTDNHDLRFETGVTWRSPGFEINDAGYLREADLINQFTWAGYKFTDPIGVFNSLYLNANQWLNWDYDGNFLGGSGNVNFNGNFTNLWRAGAGLTRNAEYVSNTRLRGGPSSKWPGNWNANFWVNSDHSKRLYSSFGGSANVQDSDFGSRQSLWVSLSYRVTDSMTLSLYPEWSHYRPEFQYVDTASFAGDERYLFGRMDQETQSLTLRLDYSISANMTLQLYAAPFASHGRFSDFKRTLDPRANNVDDRYELFSDPQILFDPSEEWYSIDERGEGVESYGFSDPDFDFREFQSNLVFRWEYRPGSTLYLVWSQNRMATDLDRMYSHFSNDLDHLFETKPTDVFLLKVSYLFMP